ncbi:MAG: AglZ/HisF2 family acetamidino modification protein [Candidatus Paceibacterota bacterium]
MLKTRVIPSLLLRDSGLVKTVNFKDAKYVGDPINAVKIFNEKEVDELILLDISATVGKKKPNFELISQIAGECFMPFGYGGGIREIDDIKRIFNLGVEKVVINSYAVENPLFIKEAANIFGSQSIVVSIDVKRTKSGNYEIFTNSGKEETGLNLKDFIGKIEKMGAGEIFLNSIDRDGLMQGFDLSLISEASKAVSIPLIVCGGAGKIEDFKEAIMAGASAVAAGSMFIFYGRQRAVLINFPHQKELDLLNNL